MASLVLVVCLQLHQNASADSYVGKKVLTTRPNAEFKQSGRYVRVSDAGRVHTVHEEDGQWLMTNREGIWLKRSDVVLVDNLLADLERNHDADTSAKEYCVRSFGYELKGRDRDAIKAISRAVDREPDNAVYRDIRGVMWLSFDTKRALADLDKVIRDHPQFPNAYIHRGYALMAQGQPLEGINEITKAIELKPKSGRLYLIRGRTRWQIGDYGNAIADLQRSLEVDPQGAAAHNALAFILASCTEEDLRDGKLAVTHAQVACHLVEWNEISYIGTLAAAYAETGDFKNAKRYQQNAIDAAVENGWLEPQLEELRQDLSLYAAGKPLRHTRVLPSK